MLEGLQVSADNATKADGNESDLEMEEDFVYGFYAPLDLSLILVAFSSILVNSLVLYLLTKKEYLRTPKNFFLGSLATCDLFTGVLAVPLFIACAATVQTPLCIAAAVLNHFICLFDVLQLLAITMDRLTAVLCPLKYPVLMNTTRAVTIITTIFIFAGFASFIQLAWTASSGYDVNEDAEHDIAVYEKAYDVTVFVLFFVPVIIMSYAVLHVFIIVHKHNVEIRKRNSARHTRLNNCEKSRWSHEMKSTIILSTMLLTYVLFWSAYFMIRVQTNFGDEWFYLPVGLENFFIFLRFSTCVSNPLLYTLRNHDFKVALKAERDSIYRKREFISSYTKTTATKDIADT